jgi:hypothetical protein
VMALKTRIHMKTITQFSSISCSLHCLNFTEGTYAMRMWVSVTLPAYLLAQDASHVLRPATHQLTFLETESLHWL